MIPFTIQDIIDQTNAYRKKQGLPSLKINKSLMQAAEARAKDMANTGNFSHSIATSSPLTSPWAFMDKYGYNFGHVGENLGEGFNTATDTMKAWQNSPTHNHNLISPNYSDIGVAIVPGKYQGKPTNFVIQFFGSSPESNKIISPTILPVPSKNVPNAALPTSLFSMNNSRSTIPMVGNTGLKIK